MPDVKLFGKKIPAWGIGVAAVGGVAVVYLAVKQKRAAAAAASSASGSAIDPVTGLPASEDSAIDPVTGEAYLAEAQQYGSVQAADTAFQSNVNGSNDIGTAGGSSGGGYGGYYGYSEAPPNTTVVGGTTYGSNSAWAQAVEAGLTDIGYSSTDVSAALGRYLSNLSETPAQAAIVQAAIAEYGPPPVGSYQIISAPSTGGGTVTTDVKIPDVNGIDVEQASSILRAAGLKPSGPAGQAGVLHIVTSTSPAEGTTVASGSGVTLHYKTQSESSGSKVPDVVGDAQAAAFGKISAAGFKPKGTPDVPGKVLYVESQSPKAGASAAKGSTVTVTSKIK